MGSIAPVMPTLRFRRLPLCRPLLRGLCLLLAASSLSAQTHCDAIAKTYSDSDAAPRGSFAWSMRLGQWFEHRGENHCALRAYLAASAKEDSSADAHYQVGRMDVVTGDPLQGARQFSNAVALNPTSVAFRLAAGETEEKLNNAAEAERLYREGLQRTPSSPLVSEHLAALLGRERQYIAAIRYWQLALSLDPANTGDLVSLAAGFTDAGQYNRAISILKDLLRTHPNDESAHFSLGAAYARNGQYPEAAIAYQDALRLQPRDSATQLSLAKVFTILLRYDDARSLLADYTAAHPRDAVALALLGRADCDLGRLKEAAPVLRKAADLDPSSWEAQYYLGVALQDDGDARDAVAPLQRAEQIRPAAVEAHFQLSRAYRTLHEDRLKDKELVLIQHDHAAQSNQVHAIVLANEGNHLLTAADPQAALDRYRQALDLDPRNARLYFDISLAYRQLHKADEEKKALLQSQALDPGFADAHNQLGILDSATGDSKGAIREFLLAIHDDPDSAAALSNLGALLARQQDTTRAEYFLNRAVESDSSLVSAWVNLGLVLAQQGKFKEGLQAEQKALSLLPNDTGARAAAGSIEAALQGTPR
jgi:tetratricopeptide (TPR) repeat protein